MGRYKNWLRAGLQSGQIGQVQDSGLDHDKAGRPIPWVEDEKPEPPDPLEWQETDGTIN